MSVQTELFFAIPGDIESRTGGYAYDRRVLRELAALGLRCSILALHGSFPYPSDAALVAAEQQFSRLADGSIVIVDGLAYGALAETARKHNRRLKIIALCHHPLAFETGLDADQAQAFRRSEKIALDCARAIIVTSPATAESLTKEFAIDSSKISIAVPGSDPAPFASCNGEPPVLLCVATLTKRKAHDVLIQALACLSHLPWTARFAGGAHYDPQWAQHLQDTVDSFGLTDRIAFLGVVDDLSKEYQRADIFVLPSHYEGYGMVYAEAIAHGLPVVATQCGAVSTLVPQDAGRVIASANTKTLVGALQPLLEEQELRSQLQIGARAAAAQLPRWQDSARIFQQTISNIA